MARLRLTLLALVAVAAVVVGELGSPLTPQLVAADAVAGAVFLMCGVSTAGERSQRAFAVSAYAAGLLWFLANQVGPLLFAWRPAMVLAMFTAQQGRVSRFEGMTVTLFAVAAVAPRSAADSWLTLGLSALLVVAAVRRVRTASTFLLSRWPLASSIALALALAVPAVAETIRLPPSTSAGFTFFNSALVGLSGLLLLVVVVRERDIPGWLTDSVIELTRDDHVDPSDLVAMLQALPAEGGARHDLEVDSVLQGGLRMLAENQRLRDALQDQIAEVRASRRRLLESADVERARVEHRLDQRVRPLLDELDIELCELIESGEVDRVPEAARCVDEVHLLRADLRQLVAGMPPQVLATSGLCAALEDLGARSVIETDVDVAVERLPLEVESALWYACAECLANVGKHAGASRVRIVVQRTPRGVEFAVTDDGVGGASIVDGGGLSGLVDRMQAVGGGLDVHSDPRGTQVEGWVPCPPP